MHILRSSHSKKVFTSVHRKTFLRIFLETLFSVNIHSHIQIHKHKTTKKYLKKLTTHITPIKQLGK